MQAISPEGIESSLTEDGSTVAEITESFTEAIDAPDSVTEPFAELVEQMAQTIDQQSEELSALRQENDELKEELKEERTTRAREAAEDRKRIHQTEQRLDSMEGEASASDNETPTPEASSPDFPDPKTPLEDVIRVPEHLVEDSLSANQARARFVVKDVHQYTRSVPAGRAIKSSELRRVLSARGGGKTYTETVSRVIEFLDELGKDSVEVNKTRSGERVVVFTDEIVERIVAYNNQSNTVVTGEGVSA